MWHHQFCMVLQMSSKTYLIDVMKCLLKNKPLGCTFIPICANADYAFHNLQESFTNLIDVMKCLLKNKPLGCTFIPICANADYAFHNLQESFTNLIEGVKNGYMVSLENNEIPGLLKTSKTNDGPQCKGECNIQINTRELFANSKNQMNLILPELQLTLLFS